MQPKEEQKLKEKLKESTKEYCKSSDICQKAIQNENIPLASLGKNDDTKILPWRDVQNFDKYL